MAKLTKKDLLDQLSDIYDNDLDLLLKDVEYRLSKKSSKKFTSKQIKKNFSNEPIVASLDTVTKSYKMGKTTVDAVKKVSFDIRAGEIVALIGPSGSGKSSILNMIGGLDRPSNGIITIDGQDISKLNDNKLSTFRNKTIGFVFHFIYLQPF